jgi:sugar phosphate isomerase/epimerase
MYTSFNAKAAGLTLSAAATIDLAARAGFEGVDLLVRDLLEAGEDPRALRAQMDGLGLRGGSFPNPVRWREDEATFAQDLARLPRQAEAAADLGLLRTATWVLPETPSVASGDEHDPQAAAVDAVARMHRERLGAIARVLDGFGIRLGLEVIGVASFRTGTGLPFVTRLGELDRVLGSLGKEAPNFGIVLDSWHLYAAGECVEAGLAWGVQRIVWIHVADLPAAASRNPAAMIDNIRGLPGENGAIDSQALLKRLSDAGYDGPVTAEPMPGCRTLIALDPETIAGRISTALRSVWPSPALAARDRNGS